MNIQELLIYGKKALSDIEDGNIKAKILLQYLFGFKNTEYITNYDRIVRDEEKNKYLELINEVKNGIPVQYITNNQEFMKLNFYVDENVLIPQPDTEILVEEAIKICKNYDREIKVLDLCTGSGAIAVSVAKYVNNAKVFGSDISKKALEIARKNAKNNMVNVEFILSDMLENIKESNFDIIVSNPPYIKTDVITTLSKEVQKEPIIALDGGEDGLLFYKKIANNYKKYIKNKGFLLLEIGYDQADKVKELFTEDVKVIKDLSGNDRVIIVQRED